LVTRKELGLVNWEALSSTSRSFTLRMHFDDANSVSAEEGSTDTLKVTLDIEQFTTATGGFVPKRSNIERELPAQVPVPEAETYEFAGNVVSWVFLGLLFANGGLNTVFEELDYSALMDAIEGPQLIAFIGCLAVKLPANLNLMLSSIKYATSVEPGALINTDNAPTTVDNVFGE